MTRNAIDRATKVVSTVRERLQGYSLEQFQPGLAHRRRLQEIDVKIVVSGTRGKSGMTRRIYEVLDSRGYDAYAKITGNHPLSLYEGEEHEIERGERVTLYENARELEAYEPADALVLENQGITDYTTRLMNETFGRPDVFVITNVRQDHRDTLGRDRGAIARSFARAVPAGTHVVNGERDPDLRAYLERELECVGATVSHVDVPEAHRSIPGAEVVYGIDEVLRAIDEAPLADPLRESLLDEYRVEWTELPRGRVFNAASVNDVESTEMIRRALTPDGTVVTPLLYLRPDRRARTASFHTYLDALADADAIDRAVVVGEDAELFAKRASFPVDVQPDDPDMAGTVLERALADGGPLLLMGNTVAQFMRALDEEIEERAAAFEEIDDRPEPPRQEQEIDDPAAVSGRVEPPRQERTAPTIHESSGSLAAPISVSEEDDEVSVEELIVVGESFRGRSDQSEGRDQPLERSDGDRRTGDEAGEEADPVVAGAGASGGEETRAMNRNGPSSRREGRDVGGLEGGHGESGRGTGD
ncbi:Mur ligase family protein [Halovivax limisalsi]|uniref:Mur ligase family protein n=1 Tax=Halovivax limisalsi TaxID=1453760 RepID=UPI001FFCA5E9|nr:Mur ligase family protein [Halovivax limisalsi]